MPTRYDRARLARLLAVADAGATGASSRDIAFGLVFPHSSPLGGNDWKASSEQRQTRRLIAQAARMIDGGFWRLPCYAGPLNPNVPLGGGPSGYPPTRHSPLACRLRHCLPLSVCLSRTTPNTPTPCPSLTSTPCHAPLCPP